MLADEDGYDQITILSKLFHEEQFFMQFDDSIAKTW